jgi:hypothetical protein
MGGPGFVSTQGKEISVLSKSSRPALGSTQPPIQRVPGFLPGGKATSREDNHSVPFSAEVTSTSPIYLHGMDRNYF